MHENEGLGPTLLTDRLKNEGLEPTLSNDRLKMMGWNRRCRMIGKKKGQDPTLSIHRVIFR
jgi:hypothetical protein